MKDIIPQEKIESKIYLIRNRKVMLDRDLAELYGVTTGNLNKAVKRNKARFPDDFVIRLNKEEYDSLIFQIGIPKAGRGGSRYYPFAFTQEGVAMLSGVLNSKRAVLVNIQIMRAFVKLRKMLLDYNELWRKIENMEKKYDSKFKSVFEALKILLLAGPDKPLKIKGFSK